MPEILFFPFFGPSRRSDKRVVELHLDFGDVVFEIFDACEPGDLLLFLVGHTESRRVPGYIKEYAEKKLGLTGSLTPEE